MQSGLFHPPRLELFPNMRARQITELTIFASIRATAALAVSIIGIEQHAKSLPAEAMTPASGGRAGSRGAAPLCADLARCVLLGPSASSDDPRVTHPGTLVIDMIQSDGPDGYYLPILHAPATRTRNVRCCLSQGIERVFGPLSWLPGISGCSRRTGRTANQRSRRGDNAPNC